MIYSAAYHFRPIGLSFLGPAHLTPLLAWFNWFKWSGQGDLASPPGAFFVSLEYKHNYGGFETG